MLPIGSTDHYAPLLLKSTGSYFNASIEISAKSTPSPNKPQASKDYLANHWTIAREGITGDLLATAWYGKVNGEEQGISPYYWNGHDWLNKNARIDMKNNLFSLEVPEGKDEMYAMSNGKEYTGNKAMTLFPNPVKDVATLLIHSKTDEDAVLRINDSKGNTAI